MGKKKKKIKSSLIISVGLTSALLDFLDMTRWLSIEELFVRVLGFLLLSTERSLRLLLDGDEVVLDPSFNGRSAALRSCFEGDVCGRCDAVIEEDDGVGGEVVDTESVSSSPSSDVVDVVDVDAWR